MNYTLPIKIPAAPAVPSTPEHPVMAVARTLRDMHEMVIARVNAGFVYRKEGVDVNDSIVEHTLKEITGIDKLLTSNIEPDSGEHVAELNAILADVEDMRQVMVGKPIAAVQIDLDNEEAERRAAEAKNKGITDVG